MSASAATAAVSLWETDRIAFGFRFRGGPEPTSQLQPPGVLALNYGYGTPVAALIAHLAYGAVLGGFYQVAA